MKQRLLKFIFVFICLCGSSYAQDREVTGRVLVTCLSWFDLVLQTWKRKVH